jgi:adenosylmethionine-8-amino-7-oxononanoate aminotransferase
VAADDIERRIEMEGAASVAAVFLEPVQNAGGCFPPPPGYFQRVREICDRHGVLLVSDEVILSGALFAAGLICRADDRGDPVRQLAPPLVCEQEHFDLIGEVLRSVLTEAGKRI